MRPTNATDEPLRDPPSDEVPANLEPCTGREPHGKGPRRLLIVDESRESREVLRTVLEARGVEILEACEARQGLRLLDDFHPDVVVLDVEDNGPQAGHLHDEFVRRQEENMSLVLLGRIPAPSGSAQVFAKPYHYGPLVRTIEQLLDRGTLARPQR